ncbi:MAG: hypothetical protein NMK33_04065 [Candidatus Cardinium sp.]|uniref:hypothetical protein n=1 Tax=Cardinium endosymbiont of Dermatophagoides farinae TaxID=2597823 RepID=UPI00118329EE|nr:hypothetical protein [Cardinium endosymbiont of Dermatophagoides farinae]TSJ80614.1 hypothetical protein FPG78_00790 [Cardinium endosymbiont of Dermatophagoides farinae]UWW96607.1 MAG: hypothetical protein NMK33_04065 [Candidatus Cardinium sp.]
MIINKNKPIRKSLIFLKKRFPVALTLSNGLFIHLLGCNAHQVSNKFTKSEPLTCYQENNHGNSFNKLGIELLQQSVTTKLYNVYELLYEKIYGDDAAVLDVIKEIKEPKQLINGIKKLKKQWKFRILEKEEDLLKILLKKFCDVVNQMNSVNDNTDSVIRELDLLRKGFYEAYYGVDIVSSNAYRPSGNLQSNL